MSGGRGAEGSESQSTRVLCVDDEPEVAELTARLLEREGERFETVTATTGHEAIERLAAVDPDCVVSDHRMPEMDGLELLAAVRERAPDLPFILFTARGDERLASEALSAGVTDYVPKRSSNDLYVTLADRIRRAVERPDGGGSGRSSTTDGAPFERLLDALPVGAIVRRKDGEFVAVNDCAASMLAIGPGDLRGAAAADGSHEKSGRLAPDDLPFERVVETGEPVEKWVGSSAGGDRQFRVRAAPLDGPGETMYVGYAVEDATGEQTSEQSLELYEYILDSAPDVVYTLDDDLRFTVVNRVLADLVGRSKEELLSEHIDLLAEQGIVDRANLEAGLEAVERVLDGEVEQARFETEFTIGSEEGVAENILTRLETDDERYGVVNVVRDITERKAHERELERQNERLEEFASIVSHDLRNPLTAAAGYLDLARESGDSEDYEKVEQAHDRMEELIDGLLTLARNGQRVEETRPADLATACERAWATVESGGATLSVTVDNATVEADPERLRSLLENLFSNAVEHSFTSSRTESDDAVGHGETGATVEVGLLAADDGFYVADDGPGIPESDRETVFERGYSTSAGGTGFGLAIVRSIAEAHGWTVTAAESEAGGARFEVRTTPVAEPLGRPS